MNDTYRELLRQYFEARDKFLVARYIPIEQKLRKECGYYERPSESSQSLHERVH